MAFKAYSSVAAITLVAAVGVAGCNAILGNDGDVHLSGAGGMTSATLASTGATTQSATSGSTGSQSATSSSSSVVSSSAGGASSSSSSASSSSGVGGAGGGGPCVPASGALMAAALGLPTPFVPVADGMQCGSSSIDQVDGRAGVWFSVNDSTPGAMQTPPANQVFSMTALSKNPGAPDYLKGVAYAARTFGSGFTNWGALMSFNLVNGMPQPPYDALAHGYKGLAFLARSANSSKVLFEVQDQYSFPQGGLCDDTNNLKKCNDTPHAEIQLTPNWAVYSFAWTELKPGGWGNGSPQGFVDASAMYIVQWATTPNASFDFEATEVGFFE